MKLNDFSSLGLALFLIAIAGILLFANIALYPAIVEASVNLTKMIFHILDNYNPQ